MGLTLWDADTVYDSDEPISAVIDAAGDAVQDAEQAVEDAAESVRHAALNELPGRVATLATRVEDGLSAIGGRVDAIAAESARTADVVQGLAEQVGRLAGTAVESAAGAGADVVGTAAELPETIVEPGTPLPPKRTIRHKLGRLI